MIQNKRNNVVLDYISIYELDKKDIDKIILIEKEQNLKISTKNILTDSIKSNSDKYYVAYSSKDIVGYFGISFSPDFIDILTIVIKEEFKRKHIATFLLKKILSIAKEKNIAKIFLEVRESNLPARNLYNKFGFKQINIRKSYYSNPIEDAIVLVKEC